ncbi:HNH endonuclease [Rhizobium ruizarguesonis]|uniref:HNH endonuclease n=1 Tax=Rhizobium ruizarguesonis TaxID=2081791 RepID=UPI001031F2EF|nr:HNH endonuclease [Rhizobium ruizarguesonis]TAV37269.1 HNH endonuclease [Rhizobium ruizarguesonis]
MKNLPQPPRGNDRADLRASIRKYNYKKESRGHDITHAEVEQIVSLYDLYEGGGGVASEALKGAALPQSLKDTVHAAYLKTYPDRILYPLRELLFKGIEKCPICGIGVPDELDHHLPQSVFKLLAIHTRNLVPMCHDCNTTKRTIFGEDGLTGFLHPYYDVLPAVDFLIARPHLQDAALSVTFEIDLACALPNGWAARLGTQFATLGLGKRYGREVNSYIASHAVALHTNYRASGQAGVRSLLRSQARYEAAVFYRNHWRPVLLRALADLDAFTEGGFADVLPVTDEMIEGL